MASYTALIGTLVSSYHTDIAAHKNSISSWHLEKFQGLCLLIKSKLPLLILKFTKISIWLRTYKQCFCRNWFSAVVGKMKYFTGFRVWLLSLYCSLWFWTYCNEKMSKRFSRKYLKAILFKYKTFLCCRYSIIHLRKR